MGFTLLVQFLRSLSLMPDQKRLLAVSPQVAVAGYLGRLMIGKIPKRLPFGCLPHSILKNRQTHLTEVNLTTVIRGRVGGGDKKHP